MGGWGGSGGKIPKTAPCLIGQLDMFSSSPVIIRFLSSWKNFINYYKTSPKHVMLGHNGEESRESFS